MTDPGTSASPGRLGDAEALDAICAILNTTDSGADAFQDIVGVVMDAGRPYVDQLPVVETLVQHSVHALPTAQILVDGVETVRLWVTDTGALQVRLTSPGLALIFSVELGDDVVTTAGPATDQP